MSCPYYWYNYNSYACRKSGKDVNEDTYYKYCRNYDYNDCPIYKGKDSPDCFLTSACIEAKGLPDDCHELTVLREFRDGYMRRTATGPADICEYYRIAPAIVEKIKLESNPVSVFDRIFNELVAPCVALIGDARHEDAYVLYRDYVRRLKKEYLC